MFRVLINLKFNLEGYESYWQQMRIEQKTLSDKDWSDDQVITLI